MTHLCNLLSVNHEFWRHQSFPLFPWSRNCIPCLVLVGSRNRFKHDLNLYKPSKNMCSREFFLLFKHLIIQRDILNKMILKHLYEETISIKIALLWTSSYIALRLFMLKYLWNDCTAGFVHLVWSRCEVLLKFSIRRPHVHLSLTYWSYYIDGLTCLLYVVVCTIHMSLF